VCMGKRERSRVRIAMGAIACVLIDPKSTIFRSNIPQTCGSCHPDVTKQFIESVHGVLAARGRSDSPTCTTCHGFHGIKAKVDPESPVNERRIALTTCPQCHAAERISKEYKITTHPSHLITIAFTGFLIVVEIPIRPTVPVVTESMTSSPLQIQNR